MYGVSQKLHNPKFKGKYFVSVIGKLQFVVLSGNTGLLSLQHVGGLTQFLKIRCSLVNCATGIMPFSTVQLVFIVEFRRQSYEAVKQTNQVHFSDAPVPRKSPFVAF
jgi:hypothetical protein